jgi:uncharacterized protein YggE
MRPRITSAVLTALVLAAAADISAGQISVSGEAEVRVVPDEVVLVLGVETFDPDLGVAKQSNDDTVEAVLAVARRHQIPDEHVTTDYLQVEPRYANGGPEHELLGYVARTTVSITLRQLDHFEALLAESLEAGANYVHGIDFRTTELRRHRDRARALAVKAAREKAVDLAAALDQQVGAPVQISEGGGGWLSGYGSWWGGRWGGMASQNVVQAIGQGSVDGPVAPGQIAVSARVNVTFELISPAATSADD